MKEFLKNKKVVRFKSKPSKGERKGWSNKADYVGVPINTIKWESKKVKVYPENRYGLPKLVP